MKSVEFNGRMKNKSIRVPERLQSVLSEDRDIRVIVLYDDMENREESDFKTRAKEQFLAGYADSDSVYDTY
jgi:hypothetical protein